MSIQLEGVSYTYAKNTPYEKDAIKKITLHIKNGEFIGIMGKTGCGKSTLIQLLAGLLAPTEGQVLLDGSDIHGKNYDKTELRRKVGVVFQFPECQLFETTVKRDVAFGLKHFGWTKARVDKAVKEAICRMGFDYEKIKEKSPLELSGGEKRRIAIAGILAAKPEILILDEPIAGLDPIGREAFLEMLKELNQEGMTILMISHNADVLAEYAKRIVILEDGSLWKDGLTKEIFAKQEELKEHGIGVSQSASCADMLRKKGCVVPQDTIGYEDLLTQMIQIGRGKRQ